jgi:hypothetical protein
VKEEENNLKSEKDYFINSGRLTGSLLIFGNAFRRILGTWCIFAEALGD